MLTHDAPLVLLAVNSPIYAPIVLAKALGFPGAVHVQLRLAAPPAPGEGLATLVDSLVLECLSLAGTLERPIIGVGDPMRLAAAAEVGGMGQPLLLGSLITKMCYWIIHVREDRKRLEGEWHEHFEATIAHPVGMTGFTVPFYDLKEQFKQSNPEGKLFSHGTDPNNEVPLFEQVRAMWKRRDSKVRLPPALLTTNPYFATEAGKRESRFSVIRDYVDIAPFNDVVMTGMFAAAEACAEGARMAAVTRFMRAISRSISTIQTDPTYAACKIWAAFAADENLIGGAVPYFGLPSPGALAMCVRALARRRVYNVDQQLRAKPSAVNNTITMRASLEAALPHAVPPRAGQMKNLLESIQMVETV